MNWNTDAVCDLKTEFLKLLYDRKNKYCQTLHFRHWHCSKFWLQCCFYLVRAKQARSWGGARGGSAPPAGNKIEIVPTKLKFALAYFNHIYRSYKWLYFTLMVMSFLKRKTNNQDLFVVILMFICAWQTSIQLLWLSSLTARKLIDISVFTLKF